LSRPDAPAEAASPAARPRSMHFRKTRKGPLPTADQSRRQSQITQYAWRHFGAPGPVIAFLNTRHDGLEAQPLHLAIESDEGLKRVQLVLDELAVGSVSPATRL
jgi:hypothetical protein